MTPKKAHIPRSAKILEAVRRGIKSFTQDIGKAVRSRPTHVGRKPAKGRPNPYVKCRCNLRVPTVCDYPACGGARAGVTKNHTQDCCPGRCGRCARCLLECPGPCPAREHCQDHCPGHRSEE